MAAGARVARGAPGRPAPPNPGTALIESRLSSPARSHAPRTRKWLARRKRPLREHGDSGVRAVQQPLQRPGRLSILLAVPRLAPAVRSVHHCRLDTVRSPPARHLQNDSWSKLVRIPTICRQALAACTAARCMCAHARCAIELACTPPFDSPFPSAPSHRSPRLTRPAPLTLKIPFLPTVHPPSHAASRSLTLSQPGPLLRVLGGAKPHGIAHPRPEHGGPGELGPDLLGADHGAREPERVRAMYKDFDIKTMYPALLSSTPGTTILHAPCDSTSVVPRLNYRVPDGACNPMPCPIHGPHSGAVQARVSTSPHPDHRTCITDGPGDYGPDEDCTFRVTDSLARSLARSTCPTLSFLPHSHVPCDVSFAPPRPPTRSLSLALSRSPNRGPHRCSRPARSAASARLYGDLSVLFGGRCMSAVPVRCLLHVGSPSPSPSPVPAAPTTRTRVHTSRTPPHARHTSAPALQCCHTYHTYSPATADEHATGLCRLPPPLQIMRFWGGGGQDHWCFTLFGG